MTKELRCPDCCGSRIEMVEFGCTVYTDIHDVDDKGEPVDGSPDIVADHTIYRCKDCGSENESFKAFLE